LVQYILPERIASLSADTITAELSQLATENPAELPSIFQLIASHPKRDRIVNSLGENVREHIGEQGPSDSRVNDIRSESKLRIDSIVQDLFGTSPENYRSDQFCDAFRRLLKTGQRQSATETVSHLMDLLAAANHQYRQQALDLLTSSIRTVNLDIDAEVVESAVEKVVGILQSREETYEYSEFIWRLFSKCLHESRFDLLEKITSALSKRRSIEGDVTSYDSMAVKKAFEQINDREVIDSLITELISARQEEATCLRNVLINIGSQEVALGLSEIISHPLRAIRQQTLKILAELGKASLHVFSNIIVDDSWFEREADRHELPDSKWYVIRNSVFVLGNLRDTDGVTALRLRINDTDVRVRREIISTLEKIGGEEASDMLIVMADDPEKEIREAAVIAAGMVGSPESAPLLIDVARRHADLSPRVAIALGKTGGPEAFEFLVRLLEDDDELAVLASGKVTKEELRVAAVKALGYIGDKDVISRLKVFQESQSATQKIFSRHSAVNKAITDILDKH
jgi:HEAT repeat protein